MFGANARTFLGQPSGGLAASPPHKESTDMLTSTGFARRLGLIVLASLSAALAGCAGMGGGYPAAPAQADSGDYSYVIGAGDTINVIVWRNPELSMTVPVRPDGKISTPLVDEM